MVDPTTALSTHFSESIRSYLPDLLGRQLVKDMVDRVAQTAPKLVEEIFPRVASLGDVQRGPRARPERGAVDRIARALETAVAQPVLLCTPALRPHLWRLFSRVLPQVGVLSHNEIPGHVRVVPVAVPD